MDGPIMDVLKLARLGWRLIAMKHKSKNPGSIVGDQWPEKATCSHDVITAWLDSHKRCNFGILLGPSSGVIDVEYDNDEGRGIIEEAMAGIVTPTYKSAKSIHRLFAYDDRFAMEKAKFGWRGTEWRFGQDAAQSVIPPSMHETDVPYEWLPGLSPAETMPAELPESAWELFEKLKAEYEHKSAREKPVSVAPRDKTGESLIDLARAECERFAWEDLLSKKGWTFCRNRGEAQDWWRPDKKHGSVSGTVNYGGTGTLRVFSTSCKPLEEDSSYDKFAFLCLLEFGDDPIKAARTLLPQSKIDDLDRQWRAAQSKHTEEADAFLNQFTPDTTAPEVGRAVADPGEFPEDCLLPPGFIGEVAQHTLATSNEPQPILALGGAMALLSVLTGRKIRNLRDNRTNLFVLGLGPSGCGKDHPRKINVDILTKAIHPELLGAVSVGSGHGFESQLRKHPSKLFQLDEIGDLLKAIKKERGSGHMEGVVWKIKMLMTSSHQLYTNSATADDKSFFMIDQPHLVIFGTATPEKFWDNLSVDAIEDGFMGRILPLEVPGYTESQEPTFAEIPDSIVEQAKAWAEFNPGGNVASENPTPVTYMLSDEAHARHASYCRDIDRKIPKDGGHSPTDGLWKRAKGRAASLALLFAASRQGPSYFGKIELIDVNLAIKITNWVTRRTIFKVSTQVSENQFQRDCNRVFDLIRQRPMDRTALCNRTPWLRRKERNEILDHLIERGDLDIEEVKTQTKSKHVYKCRGVKL